MWPNIRLLRAHYLPQHPPSRCTLTKYPHARCTLSDRTSACSVHVMWPNTHLLGENCLTEHPPARCTLSDRTSARSVHIPPFWMSASFKRNLTLKSTILQYGCQRASFKLHLTLWSTILQYGGQRVIFKRNSIWLCFTKELAEAARFRTHNWIILGSNPKGLTISFLEGPVPGIRKLNTHDLHFKHTHNVRFIIVCTLGSVADKGLLALWLKTRRFNWINAVVHVQRREG